MLLALASLAPFLVVRPHQLSRAPTSRIVGPPVLSSTGVAPAPAPPPPPLSPFPSEELLPRLVDGCAAGEPLASLLPRCFDHPLDGFQTDAMAALLDGSSVVVSAPTGSGKTAVAELALYAALARGERAIYTTPLKALSNQKYRDLSAALGPGSVGLLTGDTQKQRDAPVLVMTTEVLRNMLLEQDEMVFAAQAAGRVGVVILDEFHYMNDKSRGTVWEECCVLAPPSAKLVALSATMANARQVTRWLEAIHGPTSLVETSHRPVPLRHRCADLC